MDTALHEFKRLTEIVAELRVKCPWDQKQTLQSLCALTVEETYEMLEAIQQNNWNELKGELGDLFLHLVFYVKIAQEQQLFDLTDVLSGICEKLIRRHPHIYGDVTAVDSETVKANWEKIKLKEGRKSVLEGVPSALPALLKAYRIQDKVAGVGFDWKEKSNVWNKVKEEILELEESIQAKETAERVEEEFGDVLFSLVNYARFIKINPEEALQKANAKFKRRFEAMEKIAKQQNQQLSDLSLELMENLWTLVKQEEQNK